MRHILAHDLGTSGNKAALYRLDGTLVDAVTVPFATYYPHDGWVEQDAEDWWDAVTRSTRDLLERSGTAPGDVAVVSFSGTMMGALLLDGEGRPLRRHLMWADTRASDEERWMNEVVGAERGYRITGHRLSASYAAAKALWVRNHEPEVFARAATMVHPKDYMVYRLTGVLGTDYSDASSTNLLDIEKRAWSDDLVDAFGLSRSLLPELHAAADVVGTVTPDAAAATGLLAGTPVVMGGGDGSCACVGAGVVAAGSAYNVIGTSSWISLASDRPHFDPEMRTFTWVHLDPTLLTPCGTMQAAGFSYGWYRDTFFGPGSDERLERHLAESAPGAGGVLFLPYLLGERSPLWDHKARGAFVGMGASTTQADMTRAVFEGVGYNLRIILGILDEAVRADEIRVIGGGARNAAWMDVLAEIWGRPVAVLQDVETATSMGAAIAGGVGVGAYQDYSVAEQFARVARRAVPTGAGTEAYERSYLLFQKAYLRLAPLFAELSSTP